MKFDTERLLYVDAHLTWKHFVLVLFDKVKR